jgi:hypothetical protein
MPELEKPSLGQGHSGVEGAVGLVFWSRGGAEFEAEERVDFSAHPFYGKVRLVFVRLVIFLD